MKKDSWTIKPLRYRPKGIEGPSTDKFMDKLIKQIEELPDDKEFRVDLRSDGLLNTTDLKRFKDRYLAMEEALEKYANHGDWYCVTHKRESCDECANELWLGPGHHGYDLAQQALKETI